MGVRWKREYCSGDALLDRQNRELVNLAHDLSEAIQAGRGRAALFDVLDRLSRYARSHFVEEEWLMRCTGYPGLEPQVAQHRLFQAQAAELERGYRSGLVVLPLTLSHFLMAWLDGHLKVEDQHFAAWLRVRPLESACLGLGAEVVLPLEASDSPW